MYIGLYDSIAALPPDSGDRVVVYAGAGSLRQKDITENVTEVYCTYRVGEHTTVEFPRNGDTVSQRFEQAFFWGIKYAAKYGIQNVYGVFELSRPLDQQFLDRNCPGGITDCRPGHENTHPPCARGKSEFRPLKSTAPRHMVLRQRVRRKSPSEARRDLRGGIRS